MTAAAYAPQPQPVESRRVLSRLVDALLFLTILASPLVFIEPSPYEVVFALLALAAILAGMRFDRAIIPLALLLLVWNVSGLAALAYVVYDEKAVTFIAISFYLAVTAIVFACLLSEDVMRRLSLLRIAYILAAVLAAALGIAAYFHLLPGADLFLLGGLRAKSTFKDPNVFGPFLILPLLFLIERSIRTRMRLFDLLAAIILLAGLFLSFSRGAWGHFVFSAALMIVLMFVTASNGRSRTRIVVVGIMVVAALAILLAALLSIDAVGAMFEERAKLQEYDTSQGGRFGTQLESINELLSQPLGVGPLQFGKIFGQDPHNVYLNAFASYGWIGGIAYFILVVTTLIIGLRAVFIRAPWQPYLISIYATFVGVAVEGIVIDTDHWRHWYLLIGLVWGLSIAAVNAQRRGRLASAAVPLASQSWRNEPSRRFGRNDVQPRSVLINGRAHFHL